MPFQKLPVFSLMVLVAVAVACGGHEAPSAEPMAEAPAIEMIGGAKATEVHPGQGGSPHVRVAWMVDGANVSLTYGRPYLKGRIIGDTVEPYEGRVWRLGADEATTLSTDTDLMLGETHVPAGEYTLWILETGDGWQLIVNGETGQWGTDYVEELDFARIGMEVSEAASPVDQLTLSIGSGVLKVEWGTVVTTVPLQIHKM